ncbi:MAG TPA: nicotinate-nucleotide adenylyltransferase [Accumulibacter sp.]|nr:nicotinate-nucleotide adenylyltransferase [Accumulibacter sp.]HMW16213.1 nicotinate-nucleotide adenylyltransferase [Accumulibacter sp.]HMX21436.1 nicotinate-nucleotide adenylyltransferase [Accumulibacter sp.]HMY06838.1 nicotinate-nucleotide adenylyltransferase [Accumulibacter sp.]HNC16724.1 nicotinate-nucleotide adenylyltransferase [Accumulibacter sp.]
MPPLPERRKSALGVFGGTFDPVHFGHLRLAEEALDALRLAEVRWIPAGQPALRGVPQVTRAQRLAMVRLAIAGNDRFSIDSAEIDAEQPSFTVPTLERLRADANIGNERPLVLLLGADAYARLNDWHRWPALFELAHLAVAHRPGYTIDPADLPSALADCHRRRFTNDPRVLQSAPSGSVMLLPMEPLAISATRIRALLSNGESPRYLLPDSVIAYIRAHHLYPLKDSSICP